MEKDLKLNNGVLMPRFGFGCDYLKGDIAINAVIKAIETGYRLIDTAHLYKNETEVAIAIKNCIDRGIVTRDEIFIISKAPYHRPGYNETLLGFEESIENFRKGGIVSIDAYLLHQPYWDMFDWKVKVVESYRALETIYNEKRVKAIGVCNFYSIAFIDRIARTYPQIHQFECHPQRQNRNGRKAGVEFDIQSLSWGALNQGRSLSSDTLISIAKKYNKTVGQVALRWNLQSGNALLVRSANPEHIEENFDVWDFSLSEEDMQEIEKLDGTGTGKWKHSDNGEEDLPIGSLSRIEYFKIMERTVVTPYEKSYKRFSILPFLKECNYNRNKTKWFLFDFIPILKIETKY